MACIIGSEGLLKGSHTFLFALVLASIYAVLVMLFRGNFFSRIKYLINFIRGVCYGNMIVYEKDEDAQIRLGIFILLGYLMTEYIL